MSRPTIQDLPPIDRRRLGGLVLAVLLLAGCARPHDPAEIVYVSNERGNEVVAIDPRAGTVVRTFSPGRRPRGLLLSADGTHLYVAVSGPPVAARGADEASLPPPGRGTGGIAVIDLASGRVERVLAAGADPGAFALGPDGRTLYVADADEGVVSAVAVDGDRKPITAEVGGEPGDMVVTPDGASLFVVCAASDHVAMLDARTLNPIRTIRLEGGPRGLLLSRDGRTIFVSVEKAGKIAALSASDGEPVGLIDLAQGDPTLTPIGMVEAPDGHLFVTTGRYGAVLEVDPAMARIVRAIAHVGERPRGIAIAGDGRTLVTANGPSDDVSLIDRASGKVVRRFRAGAGPWGVVAPARRADSAG